MTDLTKRVRIGWAVGALTGTTMSCLIYGGIGFLLFGLAGLHGGLALSICMTVTSLITLEFWFSRKGGIVKAMDVFM